MTQQIRDAAQALLDTLGWPHYDDVIAERMQDLRAALVAPTPTDDELVAALMRLVAKVAGRSFERDYVALTTATAAVEAYARALLATSQQDAEHAAMYRWLRDNSATYTSLKVPVQLIAQECADVHETHGGVGYRRGLDAAIRAAMKEAK